MFSTGLFVGLLLGIVVGFLAAMALGLILMGGAQAVQEDLESGKCPSCRGTGRAE